MYSNPLESHISAHNIIEQIRKPEARSFYSDALRDIMTDYLDEIFRQNKPPDAIQELIDQNIIIFFEGSVLRGTSTERTNDFDLLTLTDTQFPEESSQQRYYSSVRGLEKYHPNKTTFEDYFIDKIKSQRALEQLYLSRINELSRRKRYIDNKMNREGNDYELSKSDFLHIDYCIDTLGTILNAIETGDTKDMKRNETPTRMIISILTTRNDYVYEVTPGTLRTYRKRLLNSLRKLKDDAPEKFATLYSELEDDFNNMHRSTQWRYPERDSRLLAEYYLRSGKFTPRFIDKSELLDIVSRRFRNKMILQHYNFCLANYPEYKTNPELLFTSISHKYGLETNLSDIDLRKLIEGEDLLADIIANLSEEAKEEIEKFERRINLLRALRRQISLPTLEQFEVAYEFEETSL